MAIHRRDPYQKGGWRSKLHEIVFEADTPKGKLFDVALLIAIVVSVLAVMLESVESIYTKYKFYFTIIEWVFTILFTIEYLLRILVIKKPFKYIFSFFGLVDLLSILPTYVGLFAVSQSSLRIVRIFRLLRMFRVLKLFGFVKEAKVLRDSLRASRDRIVVFLFVVVVLCVILGTVMYIIEDGDGGFDSIPRSIYWAIVTLTTVGYGDISPITALGQSVASIIMILGYAIIAIPTGIVTAELLKPQNTNTQSCESCGREEHDDNAVHCKFCGEKL